MTYAGLQELLSQCQIDLHRSKADLALQTSRLEDAQGHVKRALEVSDQNVDIFYSRSLFHPTTSLLCS